MSDHKHRDQWGAPAGGWPSFGPDGKRVRESDTVQVPESQ